MEKTFRLLESYGGLRLYIPLGRGPTKLESLLSMDEIKRLCDHVCLYEIYLPKSDSITKQIRNLRIRRSRAEGATLRQIAIQYGVTARQVQNICRAATAKA